MLISYQFLVADLRLLSDERQIALLLGCQLLGATALGEGPADATREHI